MDVDIDLPVKQSDILKTLRQSRFFSHAGESTVKKISLLVDVLVIPPDKLVFEKGQTGSSMYIVHTGSVKVHDNDIVYNKIGAGEVFGEMAILDNDVRSASISAVSETILLEITKQTLHELMRETPEITTSIISSLCSSMRSRVTDISNDYLQIRELETELKIGRKIQSGFLPEKLPEIDGWELADYFHAARECAGDFYDAFIVDRNGQLAFIIADVADKGVGAALFMTLFRSLLRASTNAEKYFDSNIFIGDKNTANMPEELLLRSISLTNNYISMTHGRSNMFATVFFSMIDLKTGDISYVNCGHETVEIIGDKKIKYELGTTGPVVGLFPGAHFEVKKAHLDEGDILLGYTDGVTEAMNIYNEQYGMERLQNYLCNSTQSTEDVLSGIEADIRKFTLGATQSDDITMLALKRQAGMSIIQ
ncbi:MAG: SpoIIE family protein phosphatase [Gammaproteobacteria bacterium]|nr:SpoIIE family protein phosphatase [Gammaproteobacteria bacterium]